MESLLPLVIIGLIVWAVVAFRKKGEQQDYSENEKINHGQTSHRDEVSASMQEGPVEQTKAITFRVAGVTFDNDKGKDIQTLLRKIGRTIATEEDIPFYSGLTNAEIIEYGDVAEFEDVFLGDYITFEKDPTNKYDKNAIKVLAKMPNGDSHHIGHVPKEKNIRVGEVMESNSIKSIDACFVGGKIKEVDYDYEKDKDVVVVNELTLGVEITIYIKE